MTAEFQPNSIFNDGDTSWVLVSTALVMLMIPGLGYFYSGLAMHKNALSLIFLSMLCLAIVSVQWFLFGYSLAFGGGSNQFIGDLNFGLLINVVGDADTGYIFGETSNIPGLAFVIFQGMFAAITPALAIGAAAERVRLFPLIVFVFIWTTLVYDIIAFWTWGPNGWLLNIGSLDFAGGTPVHIASGTAAIALAIVAGKRSGSDRKIHRPHNLSSVFLGTALLWFGWFGFNGGSALSSNVIASIAIINTNLSACASGLTWVIIDYRVNHKFSAFAFCSGAVAGLVCITPGAGFVEPWSAIIFGIVGSICCNAFLSHKHLYGFDDSLDVFGIHGVGGIVGNLLTGIFASKRVNEGSGWIDGNWIQFAYQLAGTVAGMLWSFLLTYTILFLMNLIPGFNLRVDSDMEELGADRGQLGEIAYDYIEFSVQEVLNTPTVGGVPSPTVQDAAHVKLAQPEEKSMLPGSVEGDEKGHAMEMKEVNKSA